MDGDPAAAMRYTEARLGKVTSYMLEELEYETVPTRPNYDETSRAKSSSFQIP